jgi:hypothetical protein
MYVLIQIQMRTEQNFFQMAAKVVRTTFVTPAQRILTLPFTSASSIVARKVGSNPAKTTFVGIVDG